MPTVVLRFDPATAARLRDALEARRYRFEERPHALFLARGPGATATAYATGTVLVTGPDAEAVATLLRQAGASGGFGGARIGSDESGKGDYFGPLVVAAVAVADAATEERLVRAGVRDSKRIVDGSIGRVADAIELVAPFEIVVHEPEAYNRLYARVGNLNTLLAGAHAEAIRRLARRVRVERVVVDRFAGGSVLLRAIAGDPDLPVEERPRAEDDVAVAAASVLARRRFLGSLLVLAEEAGIALPKGAGTAALAARRHLERKIGAAGVARYAKLHFKAE